MIILVDYVTSLKFYLCSFLTYLCSLLSFFLSFLARLVLRNGLFKRIERFKLYPWRHFNFNDVARIAQNLADAIYSLITDLVVLEVVPQQDFVLCHAVVHCFEDFFFVCPLHGG